MIAAAADENGKGHNCGYCEIADEICFHNAGYSNQG